MRNDFYGHDDTDAYVIKDRTMNVEIPIDLALEVHAFLVNNERSTAKINQCESDRALLAFDPRFLPIEKPLTIAEKFAQQISNCYQFERNNNSILMKKLEEESTAHLGSISMVKHLSSSNEEAVAKNHVLLKQIQALKETMDISASKKMWEPIDSGSPRD